MRRTASRKRSPLLCAGLAMSLGCMSAARDASAIVIARDGKPVASIVVPRDALPADSAKQDGTAKPKDAAKPQDATARERAAKIRTAALDLRAYVEKISGATLPLVGDDAAVNGPVILVGRSRLSDADHIAIPSGVTADRKEESYIIEANANRLVLAGNDDGPYHGTEYAVYDLLQRLGVRWYMPGDFGEYVAKRPTLDLPDRVVHTKPDFIQRNWWLHTTSAMQEPERRWKIRQRMNPDDMFAPPGDSSIRDFVADKKLVATRPQLFAKNADGGIDPYLPNLTNPDAIHIAAQKMLEMFRRRPGLNSIGIAPDDGMPRDFNPETMKLNSGFPDVGGRVGVPAEASMSEEWIAFVNAVAREVNRELPDKIITTNGYANRNTPPQGVRPGDHLGIMFAAIWSDTLHAYDDPKSWQMRRQGQMLRQWCAMNDRTWVYNYDYTMLVSALTPVPLTRKLARDYPLMKKWGCIGFGNESRNQWMETGIPTKYVRARLMWDASADVKGMLDDFYSHWYGPAAAPARAFWDDLESAMENTPLLGHEDRILPYVYTPELMRNLRAHLAQAEAAGGDARDRLHVKVDRLILEHLEHYMAMSRAEFEGAFAHAADEADQMMAVRRQLFAISPYFCLDTEKGYEAGVSYWNVTQRAAYYRKLADFVGGKTGTLIALLPERAQFQIDPHDDGRFAKWYQPTWDTTGWRDVSTTQPFYMQGFMGNDGYPYVGAAWYRFKIDLPASIANKPIHLYCPAVETEAWCWVNGKYIGHRPYREAYERPNELDLDITRALRPGESNVIAIRISTGLNAAQAAGGLVSRAFLFSPKK